VTADQVKPDIKPTAAQLKPKKKILPPPEGRVGTMVIMKSGKVKIVLGNEIVMKVSLSHNTVCDVGAKLTRVR